MSKLRVLPLQIHQMPDPSTIARKNAASDEKWGRNRFVPESALRTASEHATLGLDGEYCYLLYHADPEEAEDIRTEGLPCSGLVELETGQTRSDIDDQFELINDFTSDFWASDWHPAVYLSDHTPVSTRDIIGTDTLVLCAKSDKVFVFNRNFRRADPQVDFAQKTSSFRTSGLSRKAFAKSRSDIKDGRRRMDEAGAVLPSTEPRLHPRDTFNPVSYVMSLWISPRYWIPHEHLLDEMKQPTAV